MLKEATVFWAISSPQDGQQPSDADVYLTLSFLVCLVWEDSGKKKKSKTTLKRKPGTQTGLKLKYSE